MPTFLETLALTFKNLIPGGILFHPAYKILKISETEYDFTWGLGGIAGTYHLTIIIDGDDFLIKGKTLVIPSNSLFPFNVIGQLVNGAVQSAIKGAADLISEDVVKQGLISHSTKVKLEEIIRAPVGSYVEVDEARAD